VRRYLSVALKGAASDAGGMGRDRSLAEFTSESAASDAETDDAETASDTETDGDAVAGAVESEAEAMSSDESDEPEATASTTDSSATGRVSMTARVVPVGGVCDDCESAVERLWVRDGTAVCVDCVSW
jgi:hypothetical protein